MASSSDPIASLDAPDFRPSFSVDPSWLLSRDAETLTMSLLRSLSEPEVPPTVATPNAFFFDPEPTGPAPASAASTFDRETARKRPRTAGPSRKKRKSRSSNRSQTTFIAADAANFRRMVQQVTGVTFGGPYALAPPVTKPEPQQRAGCRFPGGGGLLPSLDTPSSLLVGGVGVGGAEGPLCFPAPAAVAADGSSAGGLGFDSYACFPTLDSWKLI
ncbi:calmodulin-binding protein 25-like [Rhodamnia argentea]|uniref:Calmodulin-binding protein 25-like n=1 Tax=Rhodamnia argentea TaxID=178133 RepID=A0ABM3GS84_9MYRT|nr:calmodulin-binding protein 25-like [Rhodamnia argentea]